METILNYLNANWSAPGNVTALTTTRFGGISHAPYHENNLALHVGDFEKNVARNRERLNQDLQLPSSPAWLEQTHSTRCVVVEKEDDRSADAAITRSPNTVLAIMTADCLPIVICNSSGTEIAAIHAGWRGLVNGIVEETLAKMHTKHQDLLAWVGPAICQECYETGAEVHETFTKRFPFTHISFEKKEDRFYANLSQMAELILNHHGIHSVYQSNECTYKAKNMYNGEFKYYSYRRAQQTGRIATLIWFK